MARVLGLSAFYHDSAAALVVDGEIVAAAQEERFTRVKFDRRFPAAAIRSCLDEAGLGLAQLDAVAFYEKPERKVDRVVSDFLAVAPRGRRQFLAAAPDLVHGKIDVERELRARLAALDGAWQGPLLFAEHHQSHAASAFFPSPFERAAVVVADAVGEWSSTSIHAGDGPGLRPVAEQRFPHSLGILYSAFTHYAGFKVNSGEYKLMGLAPYGEPLHAQAILDELVDLREDGSFRLDLRYFDVVTGSTMTTPAFHARFGGPPAAQGAVPGQREMDLAASIQAVAEEIVLRTVRHAVRETGLRDVCLAGGVALNCVANGRLVRSGEIDGLWVQPAAGDAGGALGAALAASHQALGVPRRAREPDAMQGALLGPSCDGPDAAELLIQAGARFETLAEEELVARVVADLAAGRIVGWCQGRMEFGPRALGNRSILGDPRVPTMQSDMNMKIKFREGFRPFAPAVLAERAAAWFDLDVPSPYMLLVADVRADRRVAVSERDAALTGLDRVQAVRSEIPAVTHVDGSARVQTVTGESNPRFHALLSAFERATGCPVLVNTSFNVRGEPIVRDARDAFRCFMGTDIDVLAVGPHYLRKADQDAALAEDYRSAYDPD